MSDDLFDMRKPPRPETAWHARRYVYKDGEAYRKNCYTLWVPDPLNPGSEILIGGAVSLRKTSGFAYIGAITPIHRLRTLMASTRHYVFGFGLEDALYRLKITYPDPIRVLQSGQINSKERAS